jgi:hypothetical protein
MNTERNAEAGVWFGTDDAPAPSGIVKDPAPGLTVAVELKQTAVRPHVRYRRPGGAWQTLEVRKGPRSSRAQ